MSGHERSGWRDQHLSERHRKWGYDCPFVDGDFLAVEYDQARAAALVDYKLHLAVLKSNSNIEALSSFHHANGDQIPFFIVRYAGSPGCPKAECAQCHGDRSGVWIFGVHPINTSAKRLLSGNVGMSEQAYVAWLYEIRGRKASETTLRTLSTAVPTTYAMERRWQP